MLYQIFIYPIELLLELFFYFFTNLFHNYGYAILFLSVVVQLFTLPLYIRAEKWQKAERDIQKKLKPKVDKIKSVFTGDEQYMILSTYYKQNNYHPIFALRSTIGLLIQIPFFIAAFTFISNLEVLHGTYFLFITDLSKTDTLFFYNGITINILSILMTVINILGTLVYTKGFQKREKIQLYIMALVFLVLLYNSPSGLVLYWTMNNIFSLVKALFSKIRFPIRKKNSSISFIKTAFDKKPSQKITLFLVSTIGLFLLVGIFIPSELIRSSPQEFSFVGEHTSPTDFFTFPLVQSAGIFLFWLPCIYALCSKQGRSLCSIVITAFFIISLLNTFLFTGNYGNLNLSLHFDADVIFSFQITKFLIDCLVGTILCIVIFLLITYSFTYILSSVGVICAGVLVVLSSINYIDTKNSFNELYTRMELSGELEYRNTIGSIEPVLNFSKTEQNVIIIMLDRGISSFIPYIFEQLPNTKTQYDGFTYYPNTLSPGVFTMLGLPPLLGGYEYLPHKINERSSENLVDKHNESLCVLPVLFSEHDFITTVLDPALANYSWIPDNSIFSEWDIYAQNLEHRYTQKWLHDRGEEYTESSNLDRNLLLFSLFRVFPQSIRGYLYDSGNWLMLNESPMYKKEDETIDLLAEQEEFQNLIEADPLYTGFIGEYSVLDYLPELTNTHSTQKTFTYIVNNTTHDPRYLQYPNYEPAQIVTDIGPVCGNENTDKHYHVNLASIKKLGEFFDYLRENEVYDNTKIIIASDHGTALARIPEFSHFTEINPPRFNSLLMVKDFNSNEELTTKMDFMNVADVPLLATKDSIDNPINPFTGNALESAKENSFTVYATTRWRPEDHNEKTFTLDNGTWEVTENLFEVDNWTKIK